MVISERIFNILIMLAVIIIVLYFYFNSDEIGVIPRAKPEHFSTPDKKVRFDDNVKYIYYDKLGPSKTSRIKTRIKTPYAKTFYDVNSDSSEIDVDEVLSEITNPEKNIPEPNPLKHSVPNEDYSPRSTKHVLPSNLEFNNPEDKWDSSFGIPLMNPKEQADYFVKMMNNYKKYGTAVGDFYEYQTDNSTLIKSDVFIDPFKPSTKSKNLKGVAVSEIYDESVKGPVAKPKKIKSINGSTVVYEDESEMNGGKIMGTNLSGFNGYAESHRPASFGNEFG